MRLLDWRKPLRRAIKFVITQEKVLLAILAIVIVISGGFWYRQFSGGHSSTPTVGGTFVEGVVADKKELSQITTRLTKTGLLSFSSTGTLLGQLSDEWSVSPEGLEYRFTLRPDVDRDEIVRVLQQQTDFIAESAVTTDSSRDVIIQLSEANPSFPLLMTRPLFDYGPYKLSKLSDQTAVFTRNTRQHARSAYLNKIIIHSYANESELMKAVGKNRLDGAVLTTDSSLKGFQRQVVNLNRYYTVLFNTNKSPFRETGLRQSLISGTNVEPKQFTLIAAESEPYKSLATVLVERWRQQGARVELSLKPQTELTGSIGPSRNFQALLIGINYGMELDPYYLWHSSQIRSTGNNLSGVNNPTIDGIVEKTRAQLNFYERQKSLDALQQTLADQSVALVVKREEVNFYVSDKFNFIPPSLPLSAADRYLAAALWSVK